MTVPAIEVFWQYRATDFYVDQTIVDFERVEYQGFLWCGEETISSSWYRLMEDPSRLRCIEVELTEEGPLEQILGAVCLQFLQAGLSTSAVQSLVGEPIRSISLPTGMVLEQYLLGGGEYELECAFGDSDELNGITIATAPIITIDPQGESATELGIV